MKIVRADDGAPERRDVQGSNSYKPVTRNPHIHNAINMFEVEYCSEAEVSGLGKDVKRQLWNTKTSVSFAWTCHTARQLATTETLISVLTMSHSMRRSYLAQKVKCVSVALVFLVHLFYTHTRAYALGALASRSQTLKQTTPPIKPWCDFTN